MQRRQSPITGQTSLLSSQSLPSCVGEEGEAMAAILEFKRTPCRGSFSEEFLSLVGLLRFWLLSCPFGLDLSVASPFCRGTIGHWILRLVFPQLVRFSPG